MGYNTPDPVCDEGADILVAGCGPAGCAAAIGMARLGYAVTLLHSPRGWTGCEGISSRTLEGLRNAGLEGAAATASPPSDRQVSWNGISSAANTEQLVLRPAFDAALLEDAAAAGVQLLPGLVRGIAEAHEGGASIHFEHAGGEAAQMRCRFFIDARGRGAPGQGKAGLRGPGTVSLLQHRTGSQGEPGSQVHSFRDGWAWVAKMPRGQVFIQLTVDATAVDLPKRAQLDDWFNARVAALPALAEASSDSDPAGEVYARGSTSILQGDIVTDISLRVGDAAMAVDPLSGNGIFQSLSSALAAPAVVNTLLTRPENSELAATFYRERVEHIFQRFTRTGRDFYRMESRWPDAPFWRERRDWPDNEPSHADTDAPDEYIGLESRPVIAGGVIASRPVAITSNQPLGVWHVAGVELAPLLRDLPPEKEERLSLLQERLDHACAEQPRASQAVTAWLKHYRIL